MAVLMSTVGFDRCRLHEKYFPPMVSQYGVNLSFLLRSG